MLIDFTRCLKDLGSEFGSIFGLISKLIVADYRPPSGLGGFAKRKNPPAPALAGRTRRAVDLVHILPKFWL